VLNCDPTLSVFWIGDMPLADIPGIIRSQLGSIVIKRGAAWIVMDPGGDGVPLGARRGEELPVKTVAKVQAAQGTAEDLYLASLSNVTVELCIAEAGGAFALSRTPSAQFDAYGAHVTAVTVEGGKFSIKDTEERTIQQQAIIVVNGGGATPTQSGLLTANAGLILSGQARNLGGKWELTGQLELSRFDAGFNKTQRSVSIEVLLQRGEAIRVATLNSADISASLQRQWGLSGGARTVNVYVRVK
jgi:hypothetical protein